MRELLARKWRPQDVRQITQITDALQDWATKIGTTLTPERKWSLPNACPNCGTSTVHRKDSANETVRQPALQITPAGCICGNCKYTWGVERFQILAAALQQDTDGKALGMTVAELIEKLTGYDPDALIVVEDSRYFHCITRFQVGCVPMEISDHTNKMGPLVQRFDVKRSKGQPVNVITLTHD